METVTFEYEIPGKGKLRKKRVNLGAVLKKSDWQVRLGRLLSGGLKILAFEEKKKLPPFIKIVDEGNTSRLIISSFDGFDAEIIHFVKLYLAGKDVILELAEGITKFPQFSLKDLGKIVEVKLPTTFLEIEFAAFQGYRSLRSIEIPEGVTEIGTSAFQGCTSLTSIKIPEGVTQILPYAFQDCKLLTSVSFQKVLQK